MNTVTSTTEISQEISKDIDVVSRVQLARMKKREAKAARKGPLEAEKVNGHIKRVVTEVIGNISHYEVREVASGIIDASTFVSESGNAVSTPNRSWELFSVEVPGLEMKKGFKLYARIMTDMDAAYPSFPFAYFAVLPSMWRRVLALPNSRAYFGTTGWLMGFIKSNWADGVNHALCLSTVEDLEKYCK
jgi:hypothetical protein